MPGIPDKAPGDQDINSEFSHLSQEIQRILQQLSQEILVAPRVLADELESYAVRLDKTVHAEFFDRNTAERVTVLCRRLLKALPVDPDERQHSLTQIAINYFVLEEDIEDDNESMIGFDDDLQVAEAVIKALGLSELLD